MSKSNQSAWTQPPEAEIGDGEGAAADPNACPDCGKVHGDPDRYYADEETASLYLDAFRDELKQLQARYPKISSMTAFFAQCPAGIQVLAECDCSNHEAEAAIRHMSDSSPQFARAAYKGVAKSLAAAIVAKGVN